MAEQIQAGKRQRELFIKKSTRVAASYLSRAKALSEIPDAAKPFFDVLENTYVKSVDIPKEGHRKTIGTLSLRVGLCCRSYACALVFRQLYGILHRG